MKNRFFTKELLVCLLCSLIVVTGCCFQIGCGLPPEKYERKVELSADMNPGGRFETKTVNGAITVGGVNAGKCEIVATIVARAETVEEAKEKAEAIEIKLEASGDKLRTVIEKPDNIKRKHFSVAYDVKVPVETSLEIGTVNGRIKITNIAGNINASAVNGNLLAESISGDARVSTVNGRISCSKISSPKLQAKTVNGRVRVSYLNNAANVGYIDIATTNGSIELHTPAEFSAKVRARTVNGKISSDIPVTVKGTISRKGLKGTIGSGEGTLNLNTVNGSIKIK